MRVLEFSAVFVGIDPGKSGCVAAILPDGAVELHDTPTENVGKGSRQAYDERAMAAIFADLQERFYDSTFEPVRCVVALEAAHSMPGQGVASMFSQGEGFGIWKGILAAHRMPWQLVTPQRWKKALMDGQPKEKAASVIVASRLFPDAPLRGPRGAALDGRADALLIAEWLRRTIISEDKR